MKHISLQTVVLAIVLFFGGCASKYMQPANLSEADMKLTQNESAIIFLRPTILGGAIQAPIAEFIDNDLKFVAIVSAKSKVFYKTTPGKHFFVVGGEGSNLLEAELEGGKTYYSYVNPYMGFAKASFKFEPVKNGNKPIKKENKKDSFFNFVKTENNNLNSYDFEKFYLEAKGFQDDLANCEWQISNPESGTWFAQNKNSMWKKYENAFKMHQEAKPEYKKIIKPEYGH
ncbi:MAG: hypothetical protein LBP40_03260 [Campylobacteraceae bacterium]|jgi:hypothetical protein|nr:hypothetical protein [Campylobacteraceae bacterium]